MPSSKTTTDLTPIFPSFMKQLLLLCAAFLMGGATLLNAQIVYVDADAAGTADGSSWDNAYTDLAVALDSAAAGDQVWIAAGRYVTPDSTSFVIERELAVYGGFAGGETSLDEADPTANETILSGDVLGNDTPDVGYDSLLAVDNNTVLLVLDTNSVAENQFTVTIDGLTIRDGAIAEDFPGGSLIAYAGAGIYAQATLDVSRVTFTANRAPFGAAVAQLFGSSAGSSFDSIISEGNYVGDDYEFYFRLTNDISLTNSSFVGSGDTVTSGVIYAQDVVGLNVMNSSFDSIIAPTTRGAAINTANVIGQRIMNCTFENLLADLGGALYFRNSNDAFFNIDSVRPADPMEAVIDSCTFTDISSLRWGGAIFFGNISHTIGGSTFQDGFGNQNAGIGGAVYGQNSDGFSYSYQHRGNRFLNNASNSSGGAVYYFSDGVDINIEDCDFEGNGGRFGGAVLINGLSSDTISSTTITNCEFINNTCDVTGGGVYLQDERFVVSDSRFTGNRAQNGALGIFGSNESYVVRNCVFDGNGVNNSTSYRGSGIYYGRPAGVDLPNDSLFITSCTFTNNITTLQTVPDRIISGGALFVSGANNPRPYVSVDSSQFLGNNALMEANGGAIYVVDGAIVDISNTDFTSNSSRDGSGGAFYARQFTEEIIEVDTTTNDTTIFERYPVDNIPEFRITRSLLVSNTAFNQGGVADLQTGQMTMKNSLVISNSVTQGQGSGGAIIINGTNTAPANLESFFINNTFYNNLDGGREGRDTLLGASGNAIALFQQGDTDADSNSVTVTIQNNAFFLSLEEEESIGIEQTGNDGNIVVNSLGGNYFNTPGQPGLAFTNVNDSEDITNTEILDVEIFQDPTLLDFDTPFPDLDLINRETNPLVDAGTTGELVPEIDYFGEERDGMPDIGAIEYFEGVRVDIPAEPVSESGLQLQFFPNPTKDVLNIINEDARVKEFTVFLSDAQGRLLGARRFASTNNRYDMTNLPTGVYNLTLMVNGKAYSQRVVKQ